MVTTSVVNQTVRQKTYIEDEVKEPVRHLIGHRLPWLTLGLLGGIMTSIIVSKYEKILSSDVRLAFFIPIIVYMSDAVGTQTETIYIRGLAQKKLRFWPYLFKETMLGLGLGTIFGLAAGLFAQSWLHSPQIGLTVGLAMFINLSVAPGVAVIIPTLLSKEHTDPALGAGPFATMLQDLISLLIYFVVAILIIF